MIGREALVIVLCFLLSAGCVSRYSIDDQYSYDGIFAIPSTDWHARIIDKTVENSKVLYLSKDSLEIRRSLDSIHGPIIRLNKKHDYPSLLISNDSIVIPRESFVLSGETSRCHLMRSDKIYDEFFNPEIAIAKEMADRCSRILPRSPFILLEFETWHNSIRVIPNLELVKEDSTFINRRIEPLQVTTKTFREQHMNPLPVWLIRLKERFKG